MEKHFRYTSEFSNFFYVLWILFMVFGTSIVFGLFSDYVVAWTVYLIILAVSGIFTLWSHNILAHCSADDEKIEFRLWLGQKKTFRYRNIVSVDCTQEYRNTRFGGCYDIYLTIHTRKQGEFSLMQRLPAKSEFMKNPELLKEKLEATEFMQIKNFLKSEIPS